MSTFLTKTLIIYDLILRDKIELWASPLKELIGWMNNENKAVVETGLEIFTTLFSKTDDRFHPVVPSLMPVLYQVFAQPDVKFYN